MTWRVVCFEPDEADSMWQTCISTLTMRHLAVGSGAISKLDDLRAPMADVLESLAVQLEELQRYKARFGELDGLSGSETE